VNVGSFCRLYVPNPAGGQDIATFSRPDAVLVGYTRDGRTITARATQPVSSLISIAAPQGTEFYKAEVYADRYSTQCSSSGTLFVSKIQIQTSVPDLAALTPIVVQNGSTTGPDGLQIVSTGSIQVKVPVKGLNLDSVASQNVAVMLWLSTQSPQVQYVSLADIQSGNVNSVTFNVNLGAYDVGLQTITALVDPGNVLNETDFTNNANSVQVHVESGASNLQLAADFPDLPNDPSYTQRLSGNTQFMQVPLGAKFNLQLYQTGASGTPINLNSKYSITSQSISPAISQSEGPTLFPNNVLVEDVDSGVGMQKLFQTFHMGNATIQIMPTDSAYSSKNITVNVLVYDPGMVGQSEPTPDDLIVKYAHKRGLPPQLIKAQIRQEGFVKAINSISANAFKYEPGYDSDYVEYSTRWHPTAIVEDPVFMPVELRLNSKDNSIRQSILWQNDIDPRDMYDMTDPASKEVPNPVPRTITPNDVGISAANYINSNVSFPDSLFDDDDFEFTAQTTVSSSYGFLQIMYLTAVIDEKWLSPSGNRHPSELFIPNENISIGTRHLVRQVKFPFDDKSPTGISLSQINTSIDKALQKYNGGRIQNYFSLVEGFKPQYTPNLVMPVFTSGQ
jgi:hypothetical protein